MKEKLKDYFTFTRTERNGIVVLLTIVGILLILPFLYPLLTKQEKVDFSEFQKEIAQLQKTKEDTNSISVAEIKPSQLHFFNPNTISFQEFVELGLSNKQAKTIVNYRNKGGWFCKKEDFKKIYGITISDYARLEPYLKLELAEKTVNKAISREIKQRDILDLNKADSLQLVALHNIGPVLASRILKFRKALGGFAHKALLKDVYGLKEETYEAISTKVSANEGDVVKLNVNSSALAELRKHPYIRPHAAHLVEQRKKNGWYKTLEQVKAVCVIPEEDWQKINPYLTVD